jgi:hypothetical protein
MVPPEVVSTDPLGDFGRLVVQLIHPDSKTSTNSNTQVHSFYIFFIYIYFFYIYVCVKDMCQHEQLISVII